MPYTWMVFSTMTAEDLKGKRPREIHDFADDVARERRGMGGKTELVGVWFDIGKEVGYALFKDLGDSKEIKKTSRKFGAIGVTKMLDADQAEETL